MARIIFGVPLASALALVGYFAAWMVWPPGLSLPLFIAFLTFGAGIGAGVGGFLAWLRPQEPRPVILATLGLALAGGLAGAWGGLMYSRAPNDEILVSVVPFTAIVFAAAASNVPPFFATIYWVRRDGRH